MALEISIWEDLSAGNNQITSSANQQQIINLLGETRIPLEGAIYSTKSEWWPLLSIVNYNQHQQQQMKSTNSNLPSNFVSNAQSNKQQLLTTNQLQDRCVSAEYLCK